LAFGWAVGFLLRCERTVTNALMTVLQDSWNDTKCLALQTWASSVLGYGSHKSKKAIA